MRRQPPAKVARALLLVVFAGLFSAALTCRALACTAPELTEMSACIDAIDDGTADDGAWSCTDYKKAITVCYPLCMCDGDEKANDVKQLKKIEDDYESKCDGEAKCASKGAVLAPALVTAAVTLGTALAIFNPTRRTV